MSVKIRINDHPLEVERGTSILHAARQNGIEIPTLCDFSGLTPHGSCRVCIVEIQGKQHTPTSCTTPVEEGMVIYTHSAKVLALRKELLQMLLSEHPSACLYCPEKHHCDECMVTLRKAGVTTGCSSCPKNRQCELQTLAEQLGIEKPDYPIRYRMVPVEKMDPFFDRDYNLCILCGRCIRLCEHLHFTNALAYTKRGTHALVGTAFYQTHLETSCTFCGACVEICPTGALSEKTRKWDGKPDGQTASTCPLCSIGCQINLLTKNDRVNGSLPNRGAGVEALCVKGRFGITELVNHPTRLKQPKIRDGQTWMETGWEEAIHTAAEKLAACPPERFQIQVSASCTNEDMYVAARFTCEAMKSRNIHTSAQAQYGAGIEQAAWLLERSQPVEIIAQAPAVLCLGLEDRYSQSVIEVQLHRAKKRGAQIVALGAQKLPWHSHADLWIQSAPGQEPALIQKLVALTGPDGPSTEDLTPLARAANLLRQSGSPVIVFGPAALVNPGMLQYAQALVENLNAAVIALPEQGNLAGALQLGLFSGDPTSAGQEMDLVYLIGEAVPAQIPGQPFILYQNIYPPFGDQPVDLLLPAAAFTEVEGTLIDSAGRVRAIHPAVKPAGEALPNWLILSRIAQAMGVPGFAYESMEEIRAEMAGLTGAPSAALMQPMLHAVPSDPPDMHVYMGYPLAQWVAGLRMLYPDDETGEGQ